MDDEVEGDGDAILLEPFKDAKFLRVRLGAGDFVGDIFARSLEAELDVIETGFNEGGEFCFVEWQARGD